MQVWPPGDRHMKTQQHLLLVFGLAMLSIFTLAAPSYADKRVALVIGNGAYQHTPALSNPPNDATDVAEALKAVGFDVTLKIDVDKRQMDQVVAQFARDGKGADALLFYYAGHGMQFEGKNYVMPVDAELQDEVSLRYELVGLDDVKSAMQLSRGVKIMVLDACRDNPLAKKFVRSISVSTRDVPKVQGYAAPEKAQGMIIVYATQADDVAFDGTGRNSPFSAAFLKEIKEPGLEVGAMFRRIGGDVYAATDGRQSPELSISMVPEYYLNQSETDQTIWARIRTNATAATLREFLNRYPNSFYAPDALALLDLLDRQARETADREAAAGSHSSGDAETARLRGEQSRSEQAANEAGARERAMAEKLAAAEAERSRLTDELAQRTADQAAADARNRAELDKLQRERDQREAELRARVDKEQTAASASDKERIVQETLAKEGGNPVDDAKALAERERAANAERDRQLQAESDRMDSLKAQIAQLEQQAAQAKTAAQAEVQRANDAKRALTENAKVAAIEPQVVGLSSDQRALAAPIEAELRRIGCYPGTDQDWDSPAVRLGVAEYARFAKLPATPTLPDAALLDNLKTLRERVCPIECSSRETAVNGRCVAKACPPGRILSRDGACVAKSAPPRVTATREVESPAPRKAAPHHAPASSGGRCFSFNGTQYCE